MFTAVGMLPEYEPTTNCYEKDDLFSGEVKHNENEPACNPSIHCYSGWPITIFNKEKSSVFY